MSKVSPVAQGPSCGEARPAEAEGGALSWARVMSAAGARDPSVLSEYFTKSIRWFSNLKKKYTNRQMLSMEVSQDICRGAVAVGKLSLKLSPG